MRRYRTRLTLSLAYLVKVLPMKAFAFHERVWANRSHQPTIYENDSLSFGDQGVMLMKIFLKI